MPMQLSLFGDDGLEAHFQSLMRMIPSTEADYATHNIHPYPARFLPHYPRVFIHHFSDEGDLVVDPMSGCGTTLAEACLQNRRAYGVDIDPIAALISKVSITPVGLDALRKFERVLFEEIKGRLARGAAGDADVPTAEEFPNVALWFRDEVLRELIVIRDTILGLSAAEELENFALLCLSAIVKPVSNADPRDIFPERDQTNPVRERKDVLAELRRIFHDNAMRLAHFSGEVNGEKRGEAVQGDARDIEVSDDSAKLVFTSPPYAYALDYARVHQLSTLLFVMSNAELLEYRRKYIGTDRVSVRELLGSFEGFEFARGAIEQVYGRSRKLGIILYNYFSDMHQVTRECKRIIQSGGHLIYVIGNSTVRGTQFRSDEVFSAMCEGLGFTVVDRLERPYYAYRMARKRNVQSNTIKADVFIIARKD
jgi:DNA modification methylase